MTDADERIKQLEKALALRKKTTAPRFLSSSKIMLLIPFLKTFVGEVGDGFITYFGCVDWTAWANPHKAPVWWSCDSIVPIHSSIFVWSDFGST